jgi:hypothetical protein
MTPARRQLTQQAHHPEIDRIRRYPSGHGDELPTIPAQNQH